MPICPECGIRVSSQERDCPDCGARLPRRKKAAGTAGKRTGSGKKKKRPAKQPSSNVPVIVGSVAAGVLVVGGLLFVLFSGGSEEETGTDGGGTSGTPVAGQTGGNANGWMASALQELRSPELASRSKNHLRQIGLGMLNYHDAQRSFPPGGLQPPAAVHGWGSLMLPYVEADHVYRRIDFKQDWNAAGNAAVMKHKVLPYLSAEVKLTTDAAGYALSHWAMNQQMVGKGQPLKLRDITDGTSNTWLAGEAGGNWKAWGHPENYRDPVQVGISTGPEGFGPPGGFGAFMLYADGSVKRVSPKISPQSLRAYSGPRDGMIADDSASQW